MKWTVRNRYKGTNLPAGKAGVQRYKVEEIVEILLANRGLRTKKEVDNFLNPLSPLDLSLKELGISKIQLDKAARRIKKAIKNSEEMIVWGDYDADGLCGTAILWETIYALGGKVMPYIPDRVTEGYGLNKQAIKLKMKNEKFKILLTVDHGITAHEKIDYAKKLGLDVIVTDHHQLSRTKPKAYAIVHSTKICGATVAWLLAKELCKGSEVQRFRSSEYLDLVAIGTIADLMPLLGPNRSFVKFGLEKLNKTQRIGLLALLKEAGLQGREIGSYEVGWILGPRLNASGRIEDAMDSLRLLCTSDRKRAKDLAEKSDRINKERKNLLEKTLAHAEGQVLYQDPSLKNSLIFLSDESYHEGVIGLVAGRLVEKFYRPAVVVAQGKKYSKASARSIKGFDIIKAIRQCDQYLVDAGGHPLAAGFTVETKRLEGVTRKLAKIADQQLDEKKLTKTLKIDCELGLSELSFKLHEAIQKMTPFGVGNPEPVFASLGLRPLNFRLVGKNQDHLKLLLDDPKTLKLEKTGAEAGLVYQPPLDGIGFGLKEVYNKLSKDKLIDVAYSLTLDEWGGHKRLQLKIKDIKVNS